MTEDEFKRMMEEILATRLDSLIVSVSISPSGLATLLAQENDKIVKMTLQNPETGRRASVLMSLDALRTLAVAEPVG